MFAEIVANSYPNFTVSGEYTSKKLENPEIDRSKRELIGKGVSKVKLNGNEVAEKVAHQEYASNELEIFQKVQQVSNGGTVELLHHYTDDSGSTHLFLELMECSLAKCTLSNFSSVLFKDRFGEAVQKLFICLKFVETMKTLHKQNIIHYDIKPDNILITTVQVNGLKLVKDVKIADFDISLSVDKTETYSATFAGTDQFMAPELLARKNNTLKQDFKFVYRALDVYSFGVTMFVLFSGKQVTKHERVTVFPSVDELLKKLPCFSEQQANELVNIGNSCLHDDPSQRLSFELIQQKLLEITASLIIKVRQEHNNSDIFIYL